MVNYSELSDFELMSCLKDDDQSAFAEIFTRYNKLLYNHAYNKIRNEAECRDLVQDTFINLWEKRDKVDNINLAGLLFTMVRNRTINLVSHQKVVFDYTESLKQYVPANYTNTDHLVRERQLAAIIDAEIAALPARMREVFELSRKNHLSNKEIATQLNLSEHTVADQIKKSLRVLRLKIGLALLFAFLQGW